MRVELLVVDEPVAILVGRSHHPLGLLHAHVVAQVHQRKPDLLSWKWQRRKNINNEHLTGCFPAKILKLIFGQVNYMQKNVKIGGFFWRDAFLQNVGIIFFFKMYLLLPVMYPFLSLSNTLKASKICSSCFSFRIFSSISSRNSLKSIEPPPSTSIFWKEGKEKNVAIFIQ